MRHMHTHPIHSALQVTLYVEKDRWPIMTQNILSDLMFPVCQQSLCLYFKKNKLQLGLSHIRPLKFYEVISYIMLYPDP